MIATKLKTNYLSKPIGIDPGAVNILTGIARGVAPPRNDVVFFTQSNHRAAR